MLVHYVYIFFFFCFFFSSRRRPTSSIGDWSSDVCSSDLGAIAADADREQLNALGEYGLKIGLGFQIADDILDVCGSRETLGKTAGQEQEAGKTTYPSLLGLEKSDRKSEV